MPLRAVVCYYKKDIVNSPLLCQPYLVLGKL